jgi:hypothetical protein
MAYITPEELKTHVYAYQRNAITEGDDTISEMAIAKAVEECKAYLNPNNKVEYRDGRLQYDTQAIFSATGNERNSLIVSLVKDLAMYELVALANVDKVYSTIQDRYDRATDYLTKVAKGYITPSLPSITINNEVHKAFRVASRPKFNHE